MEGWLEIKLEYGDETPEPITDSSFSEKFNLRIPKILHKRLVVEALFLCY
jgi:predicted HicB family RNase H-like nuclease